MAPLDLDNGHEWRERDTQRKRKREREGEDREGEDRERGDREGEIALQHDHVAQRESMNFF